MKTGLVLEGGACRGVFTSGVLDTMLDRGLTFDYCIGVSAGAGNAMNFRSAGPGLCPDGRDGKSGLFRLPAGAGIQKAAESGSDL